MVESCLPGSRIILSQGLCLNLFCSLDAESAESDDKDRYFPPFTTSMPEVLGVWEQRGGVFVVGLLDLRKEKMDAFLRLCGELETDRGLFGT